jgi:hypothetical protein
MFCGKKLQPPAKIPVCGRLQLPAQRSSFLKNAINLRLLQLTCAF